MDERFQQTAESFRDLVIRGSCTPGRFREELLRVPFLDRDAWVDRMLGLDELPADGPELPGGCVPYLPCAVDVLLRIAERVPMRPDDRFLDIGSGVGRAAVVLHLLTGHEVRGIEVQSGHVQAARRLVEKLGLSKVTFVEGDAGERIDEFATGTVFFLYCPFSGERLTRFLRNVESVSRERTVCICTVDLPLPPCSWLERVGAEDGDLAVYWRSKYKTVCLR